MAAWYSARLTSALAVTLAIVVAGAAALAIAGWQVQRIMQQPLDVPADGMTYEISAGAALRTVSNELAALGVLQHPVVFSWYGRLGGQASAIHAGEYHIEAGTTPATLLQKFTAGDVRLYSFTIVEGWTFRELLQALASQPAIESGLAYEDWPALLEQLGAERQHPEGQFLPETYRYPRGTTDRQILRQAYDLMQSTLQAEWQGRAQQLPLKTPYEALVLASIVEKETARADERARIAGVFVRRLQKGMRLQTDPTVIYGLGDTFDGNLTRRDLRADSDYNTYTRRGLPPTPIALPGKAAIHAALHPAEGDELFFVATGIGDGSHKFSSNKEQHDRAVREYLDRRRSQQRNGK